MSDPFQRSGNATRPARAWTTTPVTAETSSGCASARTVAPDGSDSSTPSARRSFRSAFAASFSFASRSAGVSVLATTWPPETT